MPLASAEYALKHRCAARRITPYNRGRGRHVRPPRPSSRDDVYDHEHEEPRSGRRRRPVADWGVGEDMFEHMPRNRFSRTAEAPPRERRFAREDERRQRPGGERPRPPRREAPERRGARARGARGGASPAAASTTAAARSGSASDEDVPSEIAAITADRDISTRRPRRPCRPATSPSAAPSRSAADPEGSLEAARYQRDRARRPRRTAHERIGARPDRLAMWAFALGLLLILIAVLTAM